MAEKEVSVIDHLLDVEHQASGLVLDAQVESEKRISEAKTKADAEYKKQYDKIIVGLEDDYRKKISLITESHNSELSTYKDTINKTDKDTAAFSKLVDSILFERAE